MWQQTMNARAGQHRQRERGAIHTQSTACPLLWDCGQAVAGSAGLDVSILVSLASFISGGLLP